MAVSTDKRKDIMIEQLDKVSEVHTLYILCTYHHFQLGKVVI